MGQLLAERARLERETLELRRQLARSEATIRELSADLGASEELREHALERIDEVLGQLDRLDAQIAASEATEEP